MIEKEPKQETLKEAATKEGLFRASQHNLNRAEAGYNAKWFKRGALFGSKWQAERMYTEEDIINALHSVELRDNKNYTKIYSEDDMREAIAEAWNSCEDNENNETFTQVFNRILQSLKQPKTPKWFVAEMEEISDNKTNDFGKKQIYYQRLKTTTINGKTYLVGTYLYE